MRDAEAGSDDSPSAARKGRPVRIVAGLAMVLAAVAALWVAQMRGTSAVAARETKDEESRTGPPSDPPTRDKAAPASPADHALAVRDRARADRMREELRALFAERGPAWGAPAPSASTPGAPSAPNFPTMPVLDGGHAGEVVDPDYLRKVLREDFIPLARQCYDAASAKNPALAGKVELKFRILGDPSVGGVVSEATLGDKTTVVDPEMETCIKESMMSVTFAAPPKGGELAVSFPIRFSHDEPDAGGG